MSKKLLAKKLIKSLSSTKGVKQSTLDNPFFGSFYKNVPSPTPLSKKIIHMGELVPQRYRNMLDAADIKGGHLLGSKKPGALDVEYNRYLNFMEDKPTKKLNKGEFKNMFFVSQSKKQKLEKLADDELKKSLSSIPLEKSSKKGMFDKNVELYNNMSQKNKNKMEEIFSTIDIAGGKGTISKQKLKSHIGRIINQAVEKQGLPEDAVVDHIIKSQINPFILGPLLNKRNLANPEIARAIKAGRLTEGDRPHLSHINPVSKDWTKAMKSENIFYGPAKLNLKTGAKKQEKIDDYLDDIGESIMGMDYPYGKMASKGGLIKKGIQKLLDSTAFNQSRRKFLKQSGAAVAAAGVPKSLLKGAATLAQASKLPLPDAVPWVKSMTNMLKGVVDSKKAIKLPNGTEIFYLKKPLNKYDSHKLSIKTADGSEDLINFKEGKNDFEIEFDIADDFATNQYLEVNKKTGYTEMIDSNFRMAPGGEDVIKDDPIVWAMEKDKHKWSDLGDTLESKDHLNDFYSVPDDTDYAHLFERYVDSFSPAGNIFKTKEIARAQRAQKLKQDRMAKQRQKKYEEEREMEFEEQFRGGYGMHGYYRGGMTMGDYKDVPKRDDNKIQPKPKPDFRFSRIRQMDDREAMARMMMAEDDKNFKGGQAVGHVIFNRSQNPNYVNMYGGNPTKNISPIISVLSGKGQFSPYSDSTTRFFADYKDKDLDLYNQYLDYADQILGGEVEDFTGGADFFALPGYEKNFGDVDYNYLDQYGAHKFYKSYNQGGMAEKFSVDDAVAMIRANPQSFVGGGLVKKLAPKVLGKLTDFKPKLTGDIYQPPKGPYTITDSSGARVLDKTYKNLDEAQEALKELAGLRMSDASTFKIFGKRPPKTAEGVSEGAPQVDLGMVGKKLPPEQPGAMYWGSREKIIGAPSEAMTGDQWLQYMQLGKHGILNPKGYPIIKHMELNDTGLATHLSRNGKKTISKEQLVKDFDDKLAPNIDVAVLGSDQRNLNVLRNIDKINLQEYRDGPLKNVLTTLKNRRALLEESISNNNKENIVKNIDAIEKSVFDNFGVANSITEGFPQKFPFELKKPLQNISQVSGARLAGFKKYAKDVSYRDQQTLGGGENYREFLFRSSNKPGSPRATEPNRLYDDLGGGHFGALSSKDKMGGFVHMRTSDRTDEFGRRILHIEEIQSDMHQPINAAARRLKKKHADWAKEGKTPEGEYAKMNERAQQDYDTLVANSKYAPRGDLMKEVDNVNEDQLKLILAKIEELSAMPQTKQTQVRIARLNRERAKVRKIIEDKRAKMAEGKHSNVPQGPFSKTEDYNEFVMKYATKVAQEGGYDGVTISTSAIKNRSLNPSNKDFMGNVIAYGPMAEGAMKKAAKKSGAKFIKTAIIDDKGRGWEVPMIWLEDAAKMNVQKGLPIYKRGGIAVNGR